MAMHKLITMKKLWLEVDVWATQVRDTTKHGRSQEEENPVTSLQTIGPLVTSEKEQGQKDEPNTGSSGLEQ